jgi:hypothetical protein
MHSKPWALLMAAPLAKSHLVAAGVSQLQARMPTAKVRTGSAVGAELVGPNKLQSSLAARMIDVIEDVLLLAVIALFTGSLVGILVGM